MAVVITVSAAGKATYKVFSSENATLATAISEVIDEMATQGVSQASTQFSLAFDTTNNVYAYLATVRMR